jgi:iron(III) transport system permease protein
MVIYGVLALFFVMVVGKNVWERLVILLLATATGILLSKMGAKNLFYLLGWLYILVGLLIYVYKKKVLATSLAMLLGVYVMSTNWATIISQPIANFSRGIERGFWSNAIFQLADHIKVIVQPPPSLLAIFLVFAGILFLQGMNSRLPRVLGGIAALAIPCTMFLTGIPFSLVGGAYIIMAAFIVRSLPASVRAGVASLQQIDPSIEEASNILGADAQYTFRKVTLPLILPALIAGLIFSFTRHMTSLSAIIFLVSAKWRIVTASILSEWEQGGVSIAAAYSTLIILFVMIAIVILNIITKRLLRGREGVDLSQGL